MNSNDLEPELRKPALIKPSLELEDRMNRLFSTHRAQSPPLFLSVGQWRPSFVQTILACLGCMLLGAWLGRSTSPEAAEPASTNRDQPPAIQIHITPAEALAMMDNVETGEE